MASAPGTTIWARDGWVVLPHPRRRHPSRRKQPLLTLEGLKDGSLDALSVSVWADANGGGYSIIDGEGNAVEMGDDWTGLVRRLETALLVGEESLAII